MATMDFTTKPLMLELFFGAKSLAHALCLAQRNIWDKPCLNHKVSHADNNSLCSGIR